ncbi:hypothetical protein MRX96_006878 [Rhipicephalus microplus]
MTIHATAACTREFELRASPRIMYAAQQRSTKEGESPARLSLVGQRSHGQRVAPTGFCNAAQEEESDAKEGARDGHPKGQATSAKHLTAVDAHRSSGAAVNVFADAEFALHCQILSLSPRDKKVRS